MIKKIWISLLFLFAISWFWVSFANPIAVHIPLICSELENVEVDFYRVVVPYVSSGGYTKFYEPNINECLQCKKDDSSLQKRIKNIQDSPEIEVFLLDKSIDLENVSRNFVEEAAIPIWTVPTINCKDTLRYDENRKYKIIRSWGTYKLEMIYTDYKPEYYPKQEYIVYEHEIEEARNPKLIQFPHFRLIAVIIETIILFAIAKLCRKEDQISNRKLILFWILPTTITLPLLRFILPLLIEEWLWYTIIWELLVTIIEAIIIKYWLRILRRKAILTSIICNIASYWAWLLIF